MELYQIYIVLIGIIIILYGTPFYIIKGKNKVYYTLVFGTVLFYLFSGVFVYFMKLYGWDNGEYLFSDLIVVALYISLPFVLIVNVIIAILYYFIFRKNKQYNYPLTLMF